jgi:hypothetical protein
MAAHDLTVSISFWDRAEQYGDGHFISTSDPARGFLFGRQPCRIGAHGNRPVAAERRATVRRGRQGDDTRPNDNA